MTNPFLLLFAFFGTWTVSQFNPEICAHMRRWDGSFIIIKSDDHYSSRAYEHHHWVIIIQNFTIVLNIFLVDCFLIGPLPPTFFEWQLFATSIFKLITNPGKNNINNNNNNMQKIWAVKFLHRCSDLMCTLT